MEQMDSMGDRLEPRCSTHLTMVMGKGEVAAQEMVAFREESWGQCERVRLKRGGEMDMAGRTSRRGRVAEGWVKHRWLLRCGQCLV